MKRVYVFRVTAEQEGRYEALKTTMHEESMSGLIRRALDELASEQGVLCPITKVMSRKEAAAFPLTQWKRKKVEIPEATPQKKRQKRLAKATVE
jgi:hypothetical protein